MVGASVSLSHHHHAQCDQPEDHLPCNIVWMTHPLHPAFKLIFTFPHPYLGLQLWWDMSALYPTTVPYKHMNSAECHASVACMAPGCLYYSKLHYRNYLLH